MCSDSTPTHVLGENSKLGLVCTHAFHDKNWHVGVWEGSGNANVGVRWAVVGCR